MGRPKPQKPIMPPPPAKPSPAVNVPIGDLGNLVVAAKRGLQFCHGDEFVAVATTIAAAEGAIRRLAAQEQAAAPAAPPPAADPAATTPPPQAANAKG